MPELLREIECLGTTLVHVIPFQFAWDDNVSFSDIIRQQSESWNLIQYQNGENELFHHIQALMNHDADVNTEETIGAILQKTDNKATVHFVLENQNVQIPIKQMHLFLFKTNVGFLTLDYGIEAKTSLNQVMDINKTLKSIKCAKTENVNVIVKKPHEQVYNESLVIDPGNGIAVPVLNQKGRLFTIPADDYAKAGSSCKLVYDVEKKQYRLMWHSQTGQPLADYIRYALEGLELTSFFNQYTTESGDRNKKLIYPQKSHIFAEVLINKNVQTSMPIDADMLRLANGYDRKYQVNLHDCLDAEGSERVFSPFDNVRWFFSKEGVSNIVLVDPESKQDRFLTEDFPLRFKTTYLYLYMLALHQYYGLLHYFEAAASVPAKLSDYIPSYSGAVKCAKERETKKKKAVSDADKSYHKMSAVREGISALYLKCIFSEVSHITHQSVFYSRVRNVLGIRGLLQELNDEMEKISGLATMIRQEQQKRDEQYKKELGSVMAIVGTFIGVIATFWKLKDIVDWILESLVGITEPFLPIISVGVTLCLIFIIFGIGSVIVRRRFKIISRKSK